MVLQPSNSARFEYISLIRTVHGKKKIPSWGISTRQQGNADLCPRTDYWVFTMCWALGIHKQRVKVSSPRYRQTVQKKGGYHIKWWMIQWTYICAKKNGRNLRPPGGDQIGSLEVLKLNENLLKSNQTM